MSARPRIHVLYEHDNHVNPHGSAHIRLLLPLAHPELAETHALSAGATLPDEAIDAVIVDRLWHGWGDRAAVDDLIAALSRRAIPMIHAIDDDLYDLDEPTIPDAPWIARALSRFATCVVTTTAPLAERARRLNPAVTTIRNALDPRLFDLGAGEHTPPPALFTVGYMGTFTHEQNLRQIVPALRTFLCRHRNQARFQLLGVTARPGCLEELFGDLPVCSIPIPPGQDYPEFVRWFRRNVRWDVGVAPLRSNPFNDCKSDLKYLDYTLCEMPGIYSDVAAYQETVRHGDNGLVCGETADAWVAALESLYASPDLRNSLVREARKDVESCRQLVHAARDWKRLFDQLLALPGAPRAPSRRVT